MFKLSKASPLKQFKLPAMTMLLALVVSLQEEESSNFVEMVDAITLLLDISVIKEDVSAENVIEDVLAKIAEVKDHAYAIEKD